MAILKNNMNGSIKGKLGNMVIRELNGKYVVSIRPQKYITGGSPLAKLNRNRFAVTVTFAKYINLIPLLNQLWRSKTIEGASAFNKIIKYNIQNSGNSYPSSNNIITPQGYPIEIINLVLKPEQIQFELVSKRRTISKSMIIEKSMLFIVMVSFESKDQNLVPFIINHLEYSLQYNEESSSNHINICFRKQQKDLHSLYSKCNIYFAEVIELSSPSGMFWSSTVCKSISVNQ